MGNVQCLAIIKRALKRSIRIELPRSYTRLPRGFPVAKFFKSCSICGGTGSDFKLQSGGMARRQCPAEVGLASSTLLLNASIERISLTMLYARWKLVSLRTSVKKFDTYKYVKNSTDKP